MTTGDNWKVICNGSIQPGFDKQQVIQNLEKLKIKADLAIRLISGPPVTVKQNIDHAAATALKTHLEKAGLQVALEQQQALALEPIWAENKDTTPSSGEPPSTALQQGEMQCPKCKTIQPVARDCAQCGVIISRYIEKQRQNQDHPSAGKNNHTDEAPTLWTSMWQNGKGWAAFIVIAVLVTLRLLSLDNTHYQALGSTPEAEAQIIAAQQLKALRETNPSVSEIRTLLQSGRFDKMESLLNALDKKTREDIAWEEPYSDFIDLFTPQNSFSLTAMDNWVNETHSAWAYLSRASYYSHAAYLARGTKYASQTSQAQFTNFYSLQKKAYEDLLAAKAKNRKLLPIYSILLIVAPTQNGSPSLESILDDAIAVNPAGYYYRYQYLRNLLPKWGGSYRQMNEFTEATDPYYSLNPRLWLLKGFAKAEQAHEAFRLKDDTTCIQLYSEALQFGAHSEWLSHRANCLANIGENSKALEDVNLSLQIRETKFAQRLKQWILSRI